MGSLRIPLRLPGPLRLTGSLRVTLRVPLRLPGTLRLVRPHGWLGQLGLVRPHRWFGLLRLFRPHGRLGLYRWAWDLGPLRVRGLFRVGTSSGSVHRVVEDLVELITLPRIDNRGRIGIHDAPEQE
jgi:hypothetical protein